VGVHLSLGQYGKALRRQRMQIAGCQPDSGNPTVEQPTKLRVLWGESPLPSIAWFGRLAYSMPVKVTTQVLLEWKSHGCPVVRATAVGEIWVASKPGGLNGRNGDDLENFPARNLFKRNSADSRPHLRTV
jgi:hypothetical protein